MEKDVYLSYTMLCRYRITSASLEQYEWAAGLLAATEPWTTLGISYDQCLRSCQDPQHELYIAHDDLQPCGVILIHPKGVAGSPYIKSIAVAEAYRGRGVGSALLKFVEDGWREKARYLFLCVADFNLNARQFYRQQGYQLLGLLPDYLKAGAAEMLLFKRLQ